MANKKTNLSAEEFVRIWQTAATMDEVAERTGRSAYYAGVRATRYRSHGVPLKKFREGTGTTVDWSALAELAKSLLPPTTES